MNRVHKIGDGRKISSWTEHERAVLRAHYRTGGAKAVAERLPGRKIWSIYREADRLNLSCKRTAYWADCQHVSTMIGLADFGADAGHEQVAAFFAERKVSLRRNAKGKSAVLLASLAQWLATNPPEFDLRRADQAWFVANLLRS